jgi:hypothetical protein
MGVFVFHIVVYKDSCALGYDAVQSHKCLPTFWRKTSLILNMEAKYFSEISVNAYQTKQCHITVDSHVQ